MTVTQKFHYKWPTGVTPIWFDQWLLTLTQEEQIEYRAGRQNGDILRQIAIDEGRMVIDPQDNSYVWTDRAAYKKYKENDPIWEKYWRRWQSETGVEFSSTIEEI
jgi:hypothetical protein